MVLGAPGGLQHMWLRDLSPGPNPILSQKSVGTPHHFAQR